MQKNKIVIKKINPKTGKGIKCVLKIKNGNSHYLKLCTEYGELYKNFYTFIGYIKIVRISASVNGYYCDFAYGQNENNNLFDKIYKDLHNESIPIGKFFTETVRTTKLEKEIETYKKKDEAEMTNFGNCMNILENNFRRVLI